MEGYAVAELAARADAVAPGLGGPVGELVALAGELTGPAAAQLSFGEIEQQAMARGREILRMTVQHVMDARAAAEPRRAEVAGADGVRRRRAERGHARTAVTWSGAVMVRRMAYRAPGAANLHPADAALNLPARRYSWQVRQAAVMHALAGSYEQAQLLLQAATGVSVGKQQLEQRSWPRRPGTRRASTRPARWPGARRDCRWRSRPMARVGDAARGLPGRDGPQGPQAHPGVCQRQPAGHRGESRPQADRRDRRGLRRPAPGRAADPAADPGPGPRARPDGACPAPRRSCGYAPSAPTGDLPAYWDWHMTQEHHRNHLSRYQGDLGLAA